MHRSDRLLAMLGLVVLALVVTPALYGQLITGGITGTVTDPSGAIIPGATVTLINQETGLKLVAATDSRGVYTFTPIHIGSYTVEVSYKGFQQAVHKNITVEVTQTRTVNFTLQPGQLTQTVEVKGGAPLLQTSTASVGQVVSRRSVNNLPLNGRNYTFLAQLGAGVTMGQADTRGLDATGDFSANGTRPAQNNYLLNGMDDNADLVDFLNGTAYVVRPSVDAVQEFKVQTSDYSAQYGRAGGAILNAVIKSGTNQIHGDGWEFLRNSGLDASQFFENAGGLPKGEFRLNQFGATLGGPVVIPHVYNGKNKTFFFVDYEGTRIRQATALLTSVPTAEERGSNFTDFSQLIAQQKPSVQTDLLGRSFPLGTIMDPATTRPVTAGVPDPVTGMTATGTGYVRDPFLNNQIPAGRLDPNAVRLLQLYPAPNAGGNSIFNNYFSDRVLSDDIDQGDARIDHNFSDRDQMWGSVSFSNEPTFKPGPFTGIADGGAFNNGIQTAATTNDQLNWTHSMSPSLINEAQIGFTRIGTSRVQPNDSTMGIPAQFGIQGIPQVPLNGGLPEIDIGGLSTLGSNGFLPSEEYDDTTQINDDLTKIYGNHTFKGGFQFQHTAFSTLQPPFSRGNFDFNGTYNEVPTFTNGNTGIAQLLLTPIATTVPGGDSFVGGSDSINASNMSNTDDGRQLYGLYAEDDWKATRKLTLNLGVRWDYFGQVYEMFGAQANFIPGAPGSAQYLIPQQRCFEPRSASFNTLTTKDGIKVGCTNNQSLGNSQLTNFSPRIGVAYELTPKLVVRAGYGWFYNGFENRGYSPNIGENYPFQFQFTFPSPDPGHPITYSNGELGTLFNGFSAVPLVDTAVNAQSLALEGIQYNYITPYTMSYNFTLEYQLSPNQTIDVGYVGNSVRHLEVFPGSNEDSQILSSSVNPQNFVPFPDFARGQSYDATEGNSYYNSLQTTFQRQFSNGLDVLADYTYSKCRQDARDLLNGDTPGYRAPYLPGFGIQGDYALCDVDVRNAAHFSGTWQLPFGKGQRFAHDAHGLGNALIGGWNTNWILTLQDGQPFGVGCAVDTINFGCNSLYVPGQPITAGLHNVNQWMNPKAFTDPAAFNPANPTSLVPLGGIGEVTGPGFHRLDFSLFKEFQTSERTHLEFRTEVFNITNTPQFNAPGFGGNGVLAVSGATTPGSSTFGEIGSTRDGAYDEREIQFALKFYW
jgi:hypothetical protein